MPCYTQREITTLMDAADLEILRAALAKHGFVEISQSGSLVTARHKKTGERISFRDGKLTTTTEGMINTVKVAYANQIVTVAAKRFGWNLTQQKEPGVVIAAKRSF